MFYAVALLSLITAALLLLSGVFSEGKTLLLPFLLFPICMPALVPAVLATERIVTNLSLISVILEIRLLIAFLCSMIVLVSLAFKFIIQE